jgi:hypothetical protein
VVEERDTVEVCMALQQAKISECVSPLRTLCYTGQNKRWYAKYFIHPSHSKKQIRLVELDEKWTNKILTFTGTSPDHPKAVTLCWFNYVTKVAVSVTNFVRSHSLIHRQFQSLCLCASLRAHECETDAKYGWLLCHTDVKWLSTGAVPKRLF